LKSFYNSLVTNISIYRGHQDHEERNVMFSNTLLYHEINKHEIQVFHK
jgi:hypothetical protein